MLQISLDFGLLTSVFYVCCTLSFAPCVYFYSTFIVLYLLISCLSIILVFCTITCAFKIFALVNSSAYYRVNVHTLLMRQDVEKIVIARDEDGREKALSVKFRSVFLSYLD